MRYLLVAAAALVIAAVVWVGVAADFLALYSAAWWAPAAMLVVPAVMGVLYLLERR